MVWLVSFFHRIFVGTCHMFHRPPQQSRQSAPPPSKTNAVSVSSVTEDTHPPASEHLLQPENSIPSTTIPSSAPPPAASTSTSASTSPSDITVDEEDERSITSDQSPPNDQQIPSPPATQLLSLPEDILLDIIRRLTHAPHHCPLSATSNIVDQRSFTEALPLSETNLRLSNLFYKSLDNLCLTSALIDDIYLHRITARAAPVLSRLVLRACTILTPDGLIDLTQNIPVLKAIDISFVPSVNDEVVAALCLATAPRLQTLLLRKCPYITDEALAAVANCTALETLDLSYCPLITDDGMKQVTPACGTSLRLLAIAHSVKLTDESLNSIASDCKVLSQFCARGLPEITDVGFANLCSRIGDHIEGIDVTDCISITRDPTLYALKTHCKKIATHIIPSFTSKTLRQILVSTLRQNIFIVHGSDPASRRETVHTVLIDNGDIESASLLTSGTTDLSLLGIVLCKSYGSGLDENTKKELEDAYGIPTSSLSD